MKKILILLALAFPAITQAKFVAETITNTALSTDSVDTTKNDPFGVGFDGKNHRLRTNNAGELSVQPNGVTQPVSIVGPVYVFFLGTTYTVQYASITFTAVSSAVDGIVVIQAMPGFRIGVLNFDLSTESAGRMTLHHQASAGVRDNSNSNILGGGLFGAGGGERSNNLIPLLGFAQNQPVSLDVDRALPNIECLVQYILVP